jgi:hypothetical protein
MRKVTLVGEHNLTIPDHKVLAKGTLNDILTRVSLWNGIPKEDLVERLR